MICIGKINVQAKKVYYIACITSIVINVGNYSSIVIGVTVSVDKINNIEC